MKRPQSLRVIGFCAVAGLLCIAGSQRAPVHAQSNTTTDDGLFTVYTIIEVDSNNEISANANGPIEDIESDEDEDLDYWWLDGPTNWQLSGSNYSASGEGQGFSSGPVPGGSSYTASFSFSIEYYYYNDDDNEDCLSGESESGDCEGWDYLYASASIDVPYPPPQINSLSTYSVSQGAQGTLTISGSNLVENSGDQLTINLAGDSAPFIQTGTPTSNTATFSYDFTWYPTGTYTLSVTNNEGTSNSVYFTVTSVPQNSTPPNSCAVTSNPQAQYTSIAGTGIAGGSGTVTVSFSGAAFAAISPSVTYGPYSTPSSIAAHIAALITKNYFRYGLNAKAFGPNIVYSGNTALGTVSNATTGPSFTTVSSPTAAAAAEMACEDAPEPPAPSAEITIVAWINGNAITLPSGASLALQAVFPPPSLGGPWSLATPGYAACVAELAALTSNSLGVVSNTASDKAYANAWLLKYSGNQDPGKTIIPSTFTSFSFQYRLFADYSPGRGIQTASIGYTPDPCGTPLAYVQGDAYPQNGQTGTSLFGDQFLLAETRVGSEGQKGWKTLNNGEEIPWVWSVIEFAPNGNPDYGRIQNASPITPTTNYQIFPTYSVYVNGTLTYKTTQGTLGAFAGLPPGLSLPLDVIQ